MPQSVFYEEGSGLVRFDDKRSCSLFEDKWNALQAEHSLSGVQIANLSGMFPLDLTQTAVMHENWDKN